MHLPLLRSGAFSSHIFLPAYIEELTNKFVFIPNFSFGYSYINAEITKLKESAVFSKSSLFQLFEIVGRASAIQKINYMAEEIGKIFNLTHI
jgi:hypothetical protein